MTEILCVVGIVLIITGVMKVHNVLKDSEVSKEVFGKVNMIMTLVTFISISALSYILFL